MFSLFKSRNKKEKIVYPVFKYEPVLDGGIKWYAVVEYFYTFSKTLEYFRTEEEALTFIQIKNKEYGTGKEV